MRASVDNPSNDLTSEGSDHLAPHSNEERARRAYFLAREVLARCQEFERELSERPGAYSASDQGEGHDAAMKLLAVGLVQLVALDCGSDKLRPWAIDYIFTTMRVLDKLHPQPSAESFLKDLGTYDADALLPHVATRVSRALGSNRVITERLFKKFISMQRETLPDLLLTSLNMPILMLRDLTQLFELSSMQ